MNAPDLPDATAHVIAVDELPDATAHVVAVTAAPQPTRAGAAAARRATARGQASTARPPAPPVTAQGREALYVRTSTEDQHGQGQLHALRQAAAARGWRACREMIDLGESGAKADRPALKELRKLAKAGKVRAVLVTGLDRLGRSLVNVVMLLHDLHAAGCAVISLRESLDFTTPAGRLQAQLMAAFAEFERALIQERVKAGLARVRAGGKTKSGRPIGRPRVEVDVAEAKRRRDAGQTWRRISMALGVKRRTLERALAGVARAPETTPAGGDGGLPPGVGDAGPGDTMKESACKP